MQSTKPVDYGLWNKLKSGDLEAFDKIYDIYIDDLYLIGIQYTQDKDYVQDCIHDMFLDLYKYRKKLSDVTNVKYYLITCLKRKINKKYKSQIKLFSETDKKKPVLSVFESIEDVIIEQEQSIETSSKLNKALTTLTKRQRKGVLMKFNEERSYEEISDIMGISIESVRTLIYRAMKKMRSELEIK